MRLLSTLLWIALFLVMLVFSVANTDITTIKLFGQTFAAPLVLLLVIFFAGGVVVGLLAAVPSWFRGRREIARLTRELAARRASDASGTSSTSGVPGAAAVVALPDVPLAEPPVR